MALLMLHDAERIAQNGRPWSFRLEYVGVNPNNKTGISDKYWYATGRGLNEDVEIGWGAVGSKPQTQLITWPELRNRVPDKLAKGYMYVDHSYVRMSVGNIAKILGQAPTPPAPTPPQTVIQPPQTKPAPAPTQPSNWMMSAAQQALGAPWNMIHLLQIVRVGTDVKGFKALDEKGNDILMFDTDGGREFARDHGIDIIFS